MEKKDLVEFLNGIFTSLGFKRKGNNWVTNGTEINRIINLQKSQYSNAFYLNYSYIINSLPLNGFISHVSNRLASEDKIEQKRITEFLDLENTIDTNLRLFELSKIIDRQIVKQMESVHKEDDILNLLKEMKHLYTVPPFVLKHFNISFEW